MNATFKVGDTYPLVYRLIVKEDNVDVTESIDFTTWSISCQYRDRGRRLVHEVATPMIAPGVLDCSLPASVSQTLQPDAEYQVDIRVRDENDVVRSSQTRVFRLVRAVSEEP